MAELLFLVLVCLYIPIGDILLSMNRREIEKILFGGPFINVANLWRYLIALIFWPILFLWVVGVRVVKGSEHEY